MTAAANTVILGSRQDKLEISLRCDRIGQRLPKACPAGAALVFHLAIKQRQSARRANEGAITLFVVQRACSGKLSIFLEHDAISGRWQQSPPFRFLLDELHITALLGDRHLRGRHG